MYVIDLTHLTALVWYTTVMKVSSVDIETAWHGCVLVDTTSIDIIYSQSYECFFLTVLGVVFLLYFLT